MNNIIITEFSTEYQLKAIKNETSIQFTKIYDKTNVIQFIRTFYDDSITVYESFYCLYLDSSNQIKGYMKISQGGINQTLVDLRLLFQPALNCLATSIILSHNHPSGNLSPSDADINLTREIRKAANIFNIRLLDHIIITEEGHKSFAEEGLI